jgi:hypothetical protein
MPSGSSSSKRKIVTPRSSLESPQTLQLQINALTEKPILGSQEDLRLLAQDIGLSADDINA